MNRRPARDDAAVDAAPRTDAKLVLIAEDEEPVAEFLAYVVADAGHKPVVAFHGRQALVLAREQWPDLLITDLMMPYLNGADLVTALRAEAAAADRTLPPVILITAAGPAQARAAGADVVLYKPVEVADIDAALRRLLASPGEDETRQAVGGAGTLEASEPRT